MSVSHSIYKHVLNIYVPLDKCICIHVPVCVCLIFQDEVLATLFLLYILYYEALVLVVSGLSGLTGYQMDAENEGFLKPQELRLRVTQGDGLGGKCRSIQYFGWERAGAEVEGREGVWGMSRPSSHLPTTFTDGEEGSTWPGDKRERSKLHNKPRTSPSHGLCSLGFHWPGRRDQKVGGTQRPVGTPETTCLTLQRAPPPLSNLSLLFIQQVSWVQFNFAPISDCRFWLIVQSFLSIWFPHPPAPRSLFT